MLFSLFLRIVVPTEALLQCNFQYFSNRVVWLAYIVCVYEKLPVAFGIVLELFVEFKSVVGNSLSPSDSSLFENLLLDFKSCVSLSIVANKVSC